MDYPPTEFHCPYSLEWPVHGDVTKFWAQTDGTGYIVLDTASLLLRPTSTQRRLIFICARRPQTYICSTPSGVPKFLSHLLQGADLF